MGKKYSDEELLEILREAEKKLGRPPKSREIRQIQTIVKRFGSFSAALKAAGINPVREGSSTIPYSKEQLIKILQQFADEFGRTPRRTDIKEYNSIRRCFGSFNAGLRAAGFTPNKEGTYEQSYTEEELLEILREAEKKLGRAPKFTEIKQRQTIVNHFGTFNAGLKAAGLTLNREGSKTTPYTKEQLIEVLCKMASELGRTPKSKEVPQLEAIKRCFGSFNNALMAAGLPLNSKYTSKNPYKTEELIGEMRQRAKELGRTPTSDEIKQVSTIRRRFGRYNKGLRAAGLTLNKGN
ncbi:homing endonuclease associated repeat-containing protein [Bacillus subtilis]|uniref:homing endonuclease associated repeat-containing protein n=1 Tax=Bacillus subtilis TaxID=1423 RepID=UPI001B916214|nr:hypothetical protein [Bacillus subtilis]CAI6330960.1 hypothetical protein NRS6096_22260 [Bacillus subtilis]